MGLAKLRTASACVGAGNKTDRLYSAPTFNHSGDLLQTWQMVADSKKAHRKEPGCSAEKAKHSRTLHAVVRGRQGRHLFHSRTLHAVVRGR